MPRPIPTLEEATRLQGGSSSLPRRGEDPVGEAENAKDLAGRVGIGRAFRNGDESDVWVFGKEIPDFLGSDDVVLLGSGVVERIGERPATDVLAASAAGPSAAAMPMPYQVGSVRTAGGWHWPGCEEWCLSCRQTPMCSP